MRFSAAVFLLPVQSGVVTASDRCLCDGLTYKSIMTDVTRGRATIQQKFEISGNKTIKKYVQTKKNVHRVKVIALATMNIK